MTRPAASASAQTHALAVVRPTALLGRRHGQAALAWLGVPRRQALLGLLCLALWALPAARHALEASMWRHMLLQFPLWLLVGALLAGGLPAGPRRAVARWNAHGISGLVATALVLAVLMVPRVLDLALINPGIEAAKCTALVLAGAALRLSWQAAGWLVQGFFLGNVLPMTAVVGQLYIDSPVRVCNAYLLDDQARLGQWLVGLAVALALGWLAWVGYGLVQRERACAPTDEPSL